MQPGLRTIPGWRQFAAVIMAAAVMAAVVMAPVVMAAVVMAAAVRWQVGSGRTEITGQGR